MREILLPATILVFHAQEAAPWILPEGAHSRLGIGRVGQMIHSPDGTRLAVVGGTGVQVNDARTGARLALFTGYTHQVLAVAVSPDNRTVATGGDDGSIHLWDVDTSEPRSILRAHTDTRSLTFSPDGRRLAGGGIGTIRLWDVDTGEALAVLEGGHSGPVLSLAFSPDGRTLASGGVYSKVHWWDLATRRLERSLESPLVLSVAFSPDGQTLASRSEDHEIQLWDTDTGAHRHTLFSHTSAVFSMAFSPDGRTLAIGEGQPINAIRLWDVNTGEERGTLAGHGAPVLSVMFSPDGQALASVGLDGTVALWKTGAEPDQVVAEQHVLQGVSGLVHSVAYSPDGRTLASGSEDGSIRCWEAGSGRIVSFFREHTDVLHSLSFSPSGNTLASGSRDGTIRLWDMETLRQLATLEGDRHGENPLAFSPDGQTLAVGGGWPDYAVRLWDVKTGQRLAALKGHPQSILSVAFSPDGRTLASADADSTVLLWDMETGQPRTLEGHAKRVPSVSFSPDGTTLASGSWDLTTRLWDVASGRPEAILEGHRIWVTAVSFSPDGRTLVSAGGDKMEDFTIRLWDVDTGKHKATLDGHKDFVYSVSFSPDGNTLASGSVDGSILLWDMSPYVSPPTAVQASPTLPAETALLANYPNPFNPETWIPYRLQAPAHVRLGIYDLRGALVRILDLGYRPAGPYLTPSPGRPLGRPAISAASRSPAACICTAWRTNPSPGQARWSSSSEEGRGGTSVPSGKIVATGAAIIPCQKTRFHLQSPRRRRWTTSWRRRGRAISSPPGPRGSQQKTGALSVPSRSTMGFGLFSIRECMTQAGGSFHIESTPGRGTRCQLTVPGQGRERGS